MRAHCSADVQVKAAGGIRTLKDSLAAIEAGATRIGATATVSIIDALADGSDNFNTDFPSGDKGAY
jgi:deoxyribose-phosphate aldolase